MRLRYHSRLSESLEPATSMPSESLKAAILQYARHTIRVTCACFRPKGAQNTIRVTDSSRSSYPSRGFHSPEGLALCRRSACDAAAP